MPDPLCVHCQKPERLHRFWWLVNGQPVCFGVEIDTLTTSAITTFTPKEVAV